MWRSNAPFALCFHCLSYVHVKKGNHMQQGDMVRFAKWEEIEDIGNSKKWPSTPKPHIGVLIEHDKLMGTVHVLYEGNILKLRSVFAEKAGRKDLKDKVINEN
jgi:hypothetical protein